MTVDPGMAPRETTPDPRPAKRIVDPDALRRFHSFTPRRCQVCGSRRPRTDWTLLGFSVHHIVPKNPSQGGDDVPGNFALVCGHGTIGCHGDLEHYRNGARKRLRENMTDDQLAYVLEKKGADWLERHYPERKAA